MLRRQFAEVASARGDAPAIVDGTTRVSYKDLASSSDALAKHMEGLGLQYGDVLAVSLPNCRELVAGFLAAAGIGAVWMPVHPQWRSAEIAAVSRQLPLQGLFTNSHLRQPWVESGAQPPRFVLADDPGVQDLLRNQPAPFPFRPVDAARPCAYLFTSGSTGRPNIVPRSHSNLIASVRNVAGALGLTPGMKMLSVVPFHHANGFANCMVLPLLTGMTAVLLPGFTPASLEATVAEEQVELLMGSPFIYSALLEVGAHRASFASVKIALSSGAAMAPAVVRRCADQLGLDVRQLYGSSETGTIAIGRGDSGATEGLTGYPLATAEVRILDDEGLPLEPGLLGEIAVRGPAVMSGYLDQPGLNERQFRDGYFRTGDIGLLHGGGGLLLKGRLKSVLNIGGIKIDPVEIEHALLEMPEVIGCVVDSVNDDRQGEVVRAVIAKRAGCDVNRQAVVAHCRRRLAEYKIPRRIELVDSIPSEVTGKRPAKWRSG